MKNSKMIGIVGGMGPYASLDLFQKILNQTDAKDDQNHLPIALISTPNKISDRTEFLLGQTSINPAYVISEIINKLIDIGANIIGIPCNTAHAPRIYNVIEELNRKNKEIKIVNMIDEVAEFIEYHYPALKRIGVLSTIGTKISRIYPMALEPRGFQIIDSDEDVQASLHEAIYDQKFGIKAQSNPITETAKDNVDKAVNHLIEKDANILILGCTELSLVIKQRNIDNVPVIDPVLILAKALIREVAPDKLKPLKGSIS